MPYSDQVPAAELNNYYHILVSELFDDYTETVKDLLDSKKSPGAAAKKARIEKIRLAVKNKIQAGGMSLVTFTKDGLQGQNKWMMAVEAGETVASAVLACVPEVGWMLSGLAQIGFTAVNVLLTSSDANDPNMIAIMREIANQVVDEQAARSAQAEFDGLMGLGDLLLDTIIDIDENGLDGTRAELIRERTEALLSTFIERGPTILAHNTHNVAGGLPFYALSAANVLTHLSTMAKNGKRFGQTDTWVNEYQQKHNEKMQLWQANIATEFNASIKALKDSVSDSEGIKKFNLVNRFTNAFYEGGYKTFLTMYKAHMLKDVTLKPRFSDSMPTYASIPGSRPRYHKYSWGEITTALEAVNVNRLSPLVAIAVHGSTGGIDGIYQRALAVGASVVGESAYEFKNGNVSAGVQAGRWNYLKWISSDESNDQIKTGLYFLELRKSGGSDLQFGTQTVPTYLTYHYVPEQAALEERHLAAMASGEIPADSGRTIGPLILGSGEGGRPDLLTAVSFSNTVPVREFIVPEKVEHNTGFECDSYYGMVSGGGFEIDPLIGKAIARASDTKVYMHFSNKSSISEVDLVLLLRLDNESSTTVSVNLIGNDVKLSLDKSHGITGAAGKKYFYTKSWRHKLDWSKRGSASNYVDYRYYSIPIVIKGQDHLVSTLVIPVT